MRKGPVKSRPKVLDGGSVGGIATTKQRARNWRPPVIVRSSSHPPQWTGKGYRPEVLNGGGNGQSPVPSLPG